jgi:hypothetical protein
MGCMGAYASVGMIIVMLGMDLTPTSFTFDDRQRKAPYSDLQKLGLCQLQARTRRSDVYKA